MNLANPFTRKAKAQLTEPASAPRPTFSVESYGLSDRGQRRSTNEDCFVIAELSRTLQVHHSNLPQSKATFSCHRGHVFLVADGVGLTVKTIEDFLLNTLKRFSNLQASEEQGVLRDLQNALFHADARIFEETTAHPEWRGMGTTLTMAFVVSWRLFVAHAGDSRCYLYSGKKLQQITQDHTMTAEMVRRGILAPENQEHHPWRHVVTNILGGTEQGVRAELHSLDLHPGDVLLLCSDGLTEMVPEDQITTILREKNVPQAACERLVAEANQRGGKDNISVIVSHIRQGKT